MTAKPRHVRQSVWSNPLWWASIVMALLVGNALL